MRLQTYTKHYLRIMLLLTSSMFWSQAKAEFTILFLGDSLTAGYGLQSDQSFPSLIEQRFINESIADITIINGGVSGSTSASAISRLQWYLRSEPDLMILALGANDGLRGLSVEQMQDNLVNTIELALESNVQVALTGMMIPPNYGSEYSADFAAVFPELAEQYNLPFLPFLLEGVAADPVLNQDDGIHPNIEGTRIVAELVYGFILPLLPASSDQAL